MLVHARGLLNAVNQRHPWSHNEHFHGWILRNLPARRGVALDVGCGGGLLVQRLAPHFRRVVGVDVDAGMADLAAARLADTPQTTIQRCSFEDFASKVGDGGFDLITMVAVLHHLDLDDTLARIPRLLAPEGRLLVVGLARVGSPSDLAIDLVSAVANPVVGLIKQPWPVRRPAAAVDGEPVMPVMPVKDPSATWAEVAEVARRRLPGVSGGRRLFFRCTLRWDKHP